MTTFSSTATIFVPASRTPACDRSQRCHNERHSVVGHVVDLRRVTRTGVRCCRTFSLSMLNAERITDFLTHS